MSDKNEQSHAKLSRRDALKTAAMGAAGVVLAPALAKAAEVSTIGTGPMIVPSRFFGKYAPSNTINVAQIGFGRIATGHDLNETLRDRGVRLVAAADVDKKRVDQAPAWIKAYYARPQINNPDGYTDVKTYQDYRVMLAEHPEIDAVIVSTPDHAHMLPVVHAGILGKAVYMQKPHSLTIAEGRLMSNALHRMGTVFQVGSQQRSTRPWPHFKQVCEAVRNGRIGNLKTIEVGLPGDPPGGVATPQPVPATLDYDHWLSTTPMVPYTLDRVHPQDNLNGRGGWLRCEQFSAGMITGWGAHHLDIAHWGMGMEYSGPVQVEATEATFATGGLWDVHGDFRVEAKYANGVTMIVSGAFPNGIKFIGDEGWVFVTRGGGPVTASDPSGPRQGPTQASSPSVLAPFTGDYIRLYGDENTEHHQDWLNNIRRGSARTASPVEVSHRSTSACLISHIAMKMKGTPLRWDPVKEQFDNRRANAMIARPQRAKYRPDRIPGYTELFG